MNPDLDRSLVTKFPKIFVIASASNKTECWYFECLDGWFDLIDQLCTDIQHYLDQHPEVPQLVAAQVKGKFGGLRFYADGGDEYTDLLISQAEDKSFTVCEVCGDSGKLNSVGWLQTLCEKHRQ